MDLHATEKLIERLELDIKELDAKPILVPDTPTDRSRDGDHYDDEDAGKLYYCLDEVELRPATLEQRLGVLRKYVDALGEHLEKRKREKEEVSGLLETVKKEKANFTGGQKRAEPEPAANGTAEAADAKKAKPAAPVAPAVVAHPKK